MNPTHPREGRFARTFRERYLRSLGDYRFFYDDVSAIGDPAAADHVFYFVPGINGTAGQIRFVLPSLTRVLGSRIYVKALHVEEFSARCPTWEKYSIANVERKLAQLRKDLSELVTRYPRVVVIASSNGLYDFAAVAGSFSPATLRKRIQLIWGACAPDRFEATPWEKVFYPLNGFEHQGHRWFAYPNHNLLRVFNPETSHAHRWRQDDQYRVFRKADLESRFSLGGIEWDYISPSQLGECTRHVVSQIRGPLSCRAYALVASRDGYWQGKTPAEIEATIRRYLREVSITFQPASHLWVVTPTFVTDILRQAGQGLLRCDQGGRTATTQACAGEAASTSTFLAPPRPQSDSLCA